MTNISGCTRSNPPKAPRDPPACRLRRNPSFLPRRRTKRCQQCSGEEFVAVQPVRFHKISLLARDRVVADEVPEVALRLSAFIKRGRVTAGPRTCRPRFRSRGFESAHFRPINPQTRQLVQETSCGAKAYSPNVGISDDCAGRARAGCKRDTLQSESSGEVLPWNTLRHVGVLRSAVKCRPARTKARGF